MFKKDDWVIYGSTGVCRVAEVGVQKEISAVGESRMYYRLTPLFDSGAIYVPVDTKVFMRYVLTKDEADALISKIPDIEECPVDSRNVRLLTEEYQKSIKSHRCEDLLQIIKTVYVKGQTAQVKGKNLCQTDLKFMKRAEQLLYGEMSISLGIPFEEIEEYITKRLEEC